MQNNTRENNIRCTYKRWGNIADSWFALKQAISKLKSIYQVASGLNSFFYGVRVGSFFGGERRFSNPPYLRTGRSPYLGL